MNLKKFGKVFTSKSVATGPSSYEKLIYRAAVPRSLRNTALSDLTVSNLPYTARLLDCQLPTLVVSMKISFISLFFVLSGRFAFVRLLPFIVCYIMNTSCFSRLSGIS